MVLLLQMLALCHAVMLLILVSSGNRHHSASGFVPFAFNTKSPVRSWSRDNLFNVGEVVLGATGGGGGGGPPKNWFWGTNPYVVLRYFARDEVTDDELKRFLETNQIRTLKDLDKNIVDAMPYVKRETAARFTTEVYNACEREEETAERFLRGEKVYDEKTIVNTYETYSEVAVAVTPLKVGNRNYRFTLVLGPSGSGKTMFALRRLPSLIFQGGETAIFRVHFRTYLAYHRMQDRKISFPAAVASYVEGCIRAKLSTSSSLTNVNTVNLGLHVILDEAGRETYQDLFDTAGKILDIVDAVKTTMTYKFLNKVHVTVVGTGLDITTKGVDSSTETTKFRMLPWKLENFDKLVDVSGYPLPEKAKQVVRSFPILLSLVSNARCAYFLLKAMPNPLFLEYFGMKTSLNTIIANVAFDYIDTNSLRTLKRAEDKWTVVRSVFREIDKATSLPNVAYIPRFEDLSGSYRAIALSLIDIQTDLKDGKLTLHDSKYSVSTSPAISIVFSLLLNAAAEVSWDWQTFQSIVALGEWKRMIVQSKNTPTHHDPTIVQIPFRVPARSAKTALTIPEVNQFMVAMNGPSATYADVIAPFRLVRTLFSKTVTAKTQTLNLQNELNKMGLTNSPDHTMQQAVSSVLYQKWSSRERIPAAPQVVATPRPSYQDRSEYFPSDRLISEFPSETPAVVKCKLHNGFVTVGNRRVDSLMAFEENRPVTAVFATNCMAFELRCKKSLQETRIASSDDTSQEESDGQEHHPSVDVTEKVIIDPNDVDWQGRLKSKVLPDAAVSGLRKHVEVRFLFVAS